MNKFILAVMLLVAISIPSLADTKGTMYAEITKAVNGATLWGLPVLEMSITKTPLLIDLEFRNNFTAPRGSMGIPNHLSSELNVHLGVKQGAYWATFSLGEEYVYAGNDYGRPEGWEFCNTLRMGISW